MAAKTVVTHLADDRKAGMTLAELNQFIQEADRLGIDPRTPVMVRVGFHFNATAIEVQG